MLKIGALSFINALPFFCPFIDKRVKFDGDITYGTPTEINSLLENGDVDVGLISSASFIANREKYILLTNLGIGATRSVQSVCLYSAKPLSELRKATFAIPSASFTSVKLLKILCQYFWKIEARFEEYKAGRNIRTLLKKCDGVLIIGDDCLLANTESNFHVTDLSSAWYEFTKKPFVFAVFATRIDSWMDHPDEVRDFHQKLFSAYDMSTANFELTLDAAHAKTGLSNDGLKNYYKCLDYYLDSEHFQGLEQFSKLQLQQKGS